MRAGSPSTHVAVAWRKACWSHRQHPIPPFHALSLAQKIILGSAAGILHREGGVCRLRTRRLRLLAKWRGHGSRLLLRVALARLGPTQAGRGGTRGWEGTSSGAMPHSECTPLGEAEAGATVQPAWLGRIGRIPWVGQTTGSTRVP